MFALSIFFLLFQTANRCFPKSLDLFNFPCSFSLMFFFVFYKTTSQAIQHFNWLPLKGLSFGIPNATQPPSNLSMHQWPWMKSNPVVFWMDVTLQVCAEAKTSPGKKVERHAFFFLFKATKDILSRLREQEESTHLCRFVSPLLLPLRLLSITLPEAKLHSLLRSNKVMRVIYKLLWSTSELRPSVAPSCAFFLLLLFSVTSLLVHQIPPCKNSLFHSENCRRFLGGKKNSLKTCMSSCACLCAMSS